jgi:hypothetical protein
MFDQVRTAALAALKAQDDLLQALRDYSNDPSQIPPSTTDVSTLRELVFRKIYPVAAFSVLLKLDAETAIEVLLARYLGDTVDADRGFGGFIFDLSTMLSDLVEFGGLQSLRDLLNHPRFNNSLKADPRFIECLSSAADLEESDALKFVNSSSG